MPKITIIIGLPGSGKTMYLKDNAEKFRDFFICDDYHKSGYKKSKCFEDSLFYDDMQKALKEGKNVALTDIAYCKTERLKNAEEGIKKIAKELNLKIKTEYLYFENDPETCKQNILRRNRANRIFRELKYIDETSKQYAIPKGVKIFPVFRKEKNI